MNVLIVDDEIMWAENIKTHLESFFQKLKLKIHYTITENTNNELIEKIENGIFDIALLDIELQDKTSGLGISKMIKRHNKYTVCIFVTSHSEFALDGWKAKGFGYIVKPFSQKEIEETLKQAVIYLRGVKTIEKSNFVSFNSKVTVNMNKVVCLVSSNHSVTIYTLDKKMKVSNVPLKTISKMLGEDFIYANKGVIINTKYIISISEGIVTLCGGKEFVIAQKRLSQIKKSLVNT